MQNSMANSTVPSGGAHLQANDELYRFFIFLKNRKSKKSHPWGGPGRSPWAPGPLGPIFEAPGPLPWAQFFGGQFLLMPKNSPIFR